MLLGSAHLVEGGFMQCWGRLCCQH